MLVIALIAVSGAAAEPAFSFDATPGKLPKTVVPIHYAIELKPNLETLALAGSEVVDIEVREPTARLVLNAENMTLSVGHHRRRSAERQDRARQRRRDRDTHLSAAACRRPPPAAHRLHGADRQVRFRPLRRRLSDRQGQQADDLEPSRARGRPPRLPLLGRAGLQGDVRAHRHRAALVPRGQQHAGGARGSGQRDLEEGLVPADAEDVELPRAAHGRRARADQRRG